ncbi:MAG: hypothetical protein ACLUI3_14730 [Christensenellales bacterium]
MSVDVVVVGAPRVLRRKHRAGSGRERADSAKTRDRRFTARSGGRFGAGTEWQTAQGFTDTPDMMYDYLMF